MSSIAIGIYHLPLVHPHNPVSIHPADAKALGIRNGDKVRISTPGNSVEAVAMLRDGVMRGAIAVEHGYGHKEDRKSTRLNSSHVAISYAVFCFKKKNRNRRMLNTI